VKELESEVEFCRRIMKSWEKLRLLYNGVLLLPGIALLFGVRANVCFCLGPYSEFIVTALGFPLTARKIRVLLFSLGLIMSLGIIILVWFLVEFSLSFPSPP